MTTKATTTTVEKVRRLPHPAMTQVIEDNRAALDTHLAAVAEILARVGNPIGELTLSSKDLPTSLTITWRRDDRR
jgi:hypothetical protein